MPLHLFTKKEYEWYKKTRKVRIRVARPLLKIFVAIGVRPMMLSSLGVLVLVGYWYYLSVPLLAALFILLNVIFDGLDGALATYTRKESQHGAAVDMLADHFSLVIIVLGFIFANLVNLWPGLIYIGLYLLMVILILIQHLQGRYPGFVLKSKYFVYIIFGLFAVTGLNYLEPALLLFSLIMLITTVRDLIKLLR